MKAIIIGLLVVTSISSFAKTQSKRVSDALKQDLKITKKVLKSFGATRNIDTHTSEIVSGGYFVWTTVRGLATYKNGHECETRVVSTAKVAEQDLMKGISIRCYGAGGAIYLDSFDPGVTP